ncbi:MAG: SurA N-terminal domain-containing protein, partial [Alphaproteobacteria bacterium]
MMKITAAAIALATVFALSSGAVYSQDEPDLDPVVAIVNGVEIYQSEVEDMFARLPQNMRNVPPQVLYPMVVDRLISNELIITEADKQNLGESDQVLKEVERFRREAIQRAYLLGFVAEHVTEAAMKARYDEQIASMPQEEEVHARHILLETEEDAQAVIEELQGGGDFETLARERSTGPSGPQGGDLG